MFRGRFRAVPVLLVTIGLAWSALVQPASAATPRKSGKLVAASSVFVGTTITLTGFVAPKTKRRVELQYKSGKKWKRIKRATSTRNGQFTFRVKATKNRTYRVHAPRTKTKGRTLSARVTPARTVKVRARPAAPAPTSPIAPTKPIKSPLPAGLDHTAASFSPAFSEISGNGRYVYFVDCTAPSDTDSPRQLIVRWDTSTGAALRVSNTGLPCWQSARFAPYSPPAVSHDGRYVAFSTAGVPGEGYVGDIVIWDATTQRTTSVASAALGDEYVGTLFRPQISADGSVIAFLAPQDTGVELTVFNRLTGEVRVLDAPGLDVWYESFSLSGDGKHVAYRHGWPAAVSVWATESDEVTTIERDIPLGSFDSYGVGTSLSADGRFVAYNSAVASPDGGSYISANRLRIWDRDTGITIEPTTGDAGVLPLATYRPRISADGRYVTFLQAASVNPPARLLRYDRIQNSLRTISFGGLRVPVVGFNTVVGLPRWSMSADARYVAFTSWYDDHNDESPEPLGIFRWDTHRDLAGTP